MELFVLFLIVLAIVLIVLSSSGSSRRNQQYSQIPQLHQYDSPKQAPPSPPKPTVSWIPPNQDTIIAGRTILGGFLYVGRTHQANTWSWTFDPSLIDIDLPVHDPGAASTLSDPGYWPSYARLDPQARSAYLRWLADGRRDPLVNIGFVFLFFYGLERRLLVDAKTSGQAKTEAPSIIAEVKRLLSLYRENGSFTRYASRFVEACEYLYAPESVNATPPTEVARGQFPLTLKVTLSDFALNKKPIPWQWALSWLEHSFEFSPRTPTRRCRDEFVRLFEIRYGAKYGEGMIVKPNKTFLRFEYRPASAAFQSPVVLESQEAPDVTALAGPIQKLKEIAEQCTEDLESYSRYLGKADARHGDLLSLGLLPAELLAESTHDALISLKRWLNSTLTLVQFAHADTKELLAFFTLANSEKVTRTDAAAIAQLLLKLGYGMEPDQRFTLDSIDPEGESVLFRTDPFSPSFATEAYRTAALMLRLATTVMLADGSVSEEEEHVLEGHLESVLELTVAERQRLHAYVRWLKSTTLDLTGMKKRLSSLNGTDRKQAAQVMLFIANADNRIDPDEIKILTKVYKLLDLDPSSLYSDLHSLQTRLPEEPVTILKPDAAERGRVIPLEQSIARSHHAPHLPLSAEIIERKLRETHHVQQLLATVFISEEDMSLPCPAVAHDSSSSILGLDNTHSSLLTKLLEKPEWTSHELEALCAKHQVMPEGAVETINNVAIEKFGDLLFEFGDTLTVNNEIATEVFA